MPQLPVRGQPDELPARRATQQAVLRQAIDKIRRGHVNRGL
jgi:hypothetical protein